MKIKFLLYINNKKPIGFEDLEQCKMLGEIAFNEAHSVFGASPRVDIWSVEGDTQYNYLEMWFSGWHLPKGGSGSISKPFKEE